jgi:excisionase family DNA binding protein
MAEGLLTTEQVAARFDVSTMTVIRWCRQGLLPGAVQVGRKRGGIWLIPEDALQGFTRPTPGPKRKRKRE